MVPILAKQALARKCEFSNARMTGNYECAYALGVVSGALAIPTVSYTHLTLPTT